MLDFIFSILNILSSFQEYTSLNEMYTRRNKNFIYNKNGIDLEVQVDRSIICETHVLNQVKLFFQSFFMIQTVFK